MRSHAQFSPSAAKRWLKCHASVRASQAVPPPPPSIYAQRGTEAHALLEACIGTETYDATDIGILLGCDSDMIRSVNICLSEVWNRGPGRGVPYTIRSEVRLAHINERDRLFGTVDVIITAEGFFDTILDFKFGVVPVEPDHPQLLTYALMYLDEKRAAQVVTALPPIDLVIVQPNDPFALEPVKTKTIMPLQLNDHRAAIAHAMLEADSDHPTFSPDPEICRYCPANTSCNALQQRSIAPFSMLYPTDSMIMPGVIPKDAATLSRMLGLAKLAKVFFNACEAEAYGMAMRGVNVPRYKLVEGASRRKWYGPETTIAENISTATEGRLNISDIMPPTIIGVTELEKMYIDARSKVFESLGASRREASTRSKEEFSIYTTKDTNGKYQLVSDDDGRRGVTPTVDCFAGVAFIPQTQ
jgi:hypothetical protein